MEALSEGIWGTAYKMESAGLVQALNDHRDILQHVHFTVYTDHRALTYLHSQARHNRVLRNWLDQIREFDFDIIHIDGIDNILPDCLSRVHPDPWSDPPQLDEKDHRLYRMVAPTAEQLALIERFHKMGHFGSKHVRAQMEANGHKWSGLADQIAQVLRKCPICQRWNRAKGLVRPLSSPQAFLPWDHVQLDTIESFEEVDGYKHLAVFIDVFTQFIVVRPMKTNTAEEYAEILFDVFSIFGVPKILQTDNFSSLLSDPLAHFMDLCKAFHIFCAPYHHQGSGLVENGNKQLSLVIRKALDDQGGRWLEALPLATFALNSRILEKYGHSPFELMYNRAPNLFHEFEPLPEHLLRDPNSEDMAQWRANQDRILTELWPAVREHSAVHAERLNLKFGRRNRNVMLGDATLPIGMLVMVFDIRTLDKNEPPYVGPYEIIAYTARGTYILRHPTTRVVYTRDVPVDHLKPVMSPEEAAPPAIPLGQAVTQRVISVTNHRRIARRWQFHATCADHSKVWLYPDQLPMELVREYWATYAGKMVPPRVPNPAPPRVSLASAAPPALANAPQAAQAAPVPDPMAPPQDSVIPAPLAIPRHMRHFLPPIEDADELDLALTQAPLALTQDCSRSGRVRQPSMRGLSQLELALASPSQ